MADKHTHLRTACPRSLVVATMLRALLVMALMVVALPAQAQHRKDPRSTSKNYSVADSVWANSEGGFSERVYDPELEPVADIDSLLADTLPRSHRRDWTTWKPNPKRAMWLAIVLPGAGQIYNRKYWKLPIIYGGFVGCAYAMRWNNMMYKDYSQAYLDIMDDDPLTQSYNQFLHLGNQVTADNMTRYQEIFRKRKDRYRRWRDMSFFVMLGVYALSIIDAYVDASLSEFDISPDLTFRWSPAVVSGAADVSQRTAHGVGMNCSISF